MNYHDKNPQKKETDGQVRSSVCLYFPTCIYKLS